MGFMLYTYESVSCDKYSVLLNIDYVASQCAYTQGVKRLPTHSTPAYRRTLATALEGRTQSRFAPTDPSSTAATRTIHPLTQDVDRRFP